MVAGAIVLERTKIVNDKSNSSTVSEKFLNISPAWLSAKKAYEDSFKAAQKSAVEAINRNAANAWKSVHEAVSHE